jgi:hypothetical protein
MTKLSKHDIAAVAAAIKQCFEEETVTLADAVQIVNAGDKSVDESGLSRGQRFVQGLPEEPQAIAASLSARAFVRKSPDPDPNPAATEAFLADLRARVRWHPRLGILPMADANAMAVAALETGSRNVATVCDAIRRARFLGLNQAKLELLAEAAIRAIAEESVR